MFATHSTSAAPPLIFQVAFVTFFAVPEPQRLVVPSLVPPPLDDQTAADGSTTMPAGEKFDVHAWFEAYLAEPRDEAVELAGVPFH
jgi:hypothetical protein